MGQEITKITKMNNLLSKIISLIKVFWGRIPEDVKTQIINTIVETFDEMFRAYYKSKTQK